MTPWAPGHVTPGVAKRCAAACAVPGGRWPTLEALAVWRVYWARRDVCAVWSCSRAHTVWFAGKCDTQTHGTYSGDRRQRL